MYNDYREIVVSIRCLFSGQIKPGRQQLETGGKGRGGRERGALIAFESGYHTVHQLPVLHGSDKIPLVLIIFR